MTKPINNGLRYVLGICLWLVSGGCAAEYQSHVASHPTRSPRSQTSKYSSDTKETPVVGPPTLNRGGTFDPEALIGAWVAYQQLRWQQSKRTLNKLLKSQVISASDYVEIMILLGSIAYQEGDLNLAQHYFQKAGRADRRKVPSDEWFPPPADQVLSKSEFIQ